MRCAMLDDLGQGCIVGGEAKLGGRRVDRGHATQIAGPGAADHVVADVYAEIGRLGELDFQLTRDNHDGADTGMAIEDMKVVDDDNVTVTARTASASEHNSSYDGDTPGSGHTGAFSAAATPGEKSASFVVYTPVQPTCPPQECARPEDFQWLTLY